MTNGEKYKTAEERLNAFLRFCDSDKCESCPIENCECEYDVLAAFKWLDLEAEEENPLPCPFCGGEVRVDHNWDNSHSVSCTGRGCWYHSKCCTSESDAIAAHNRVAKAVMESEVK